MYHFVTYFTFRMNIAREGQIVAPRNVFVRHIIPIGQTMTIALRQWRKPIFDNYAFFCIWHKIT